MKHFSPKHIPLVLAVLIFGGFWLYVLGGGGRNVGPTEIELVTLVPLALLVLWVVLLAVGSRKRRAVP